MRALLRASIAILAAAAAMTAIAAGPQDHKPEVLTGGPKRDLFVVQRDGIDRIAQSYKSGYGQKIRLGGFGLTDFESLRRNLRQAGRDVALDLPGGQTLVIPNVSVDSLGEDTFQLELDRRGLVQTFADDFQEFSWLSDGIGDGQPRRGTWRTHFGYGSDPNAIGARSLASVKDLQVYVDPSFHGTAGKERHPRDRRGSHPR
jgi:hypothetical protein